MEIDQLRALLSGLAMQGILAGRNPDGKAWDTAEVAQVALECADRLLALLYPGHVVHTPESEDTSWIDLCD